MNPSQMPFHSAFNFMGSQPLPPAQPQIQPAPGGPAGPAHIMMMPPFQQPQPGFQVPNFLLQAFQQQNTPQWMLPQSQTPALAAPAQGYMVPQRPPVSAPKQYDSSRRDGTSSQDDEPAPIGSDPDDEEMLVKTLQKAKARGITPRKALDKLDKVYNYTALEWKDYFLENLERLLPEIYKPTHKPHTYGSAPPGSHPHSPPPSTVKLIKHNPAKPAKSQPSVLQRASTLNATKPAPRNNPSAHGPGLASTAHHVTEGLSTPTRVKKTFQPLERASAPAFTSPAITRTRRGAPVHEFHAGTFIPPSFGLVAPKPPHRDRSQDAAKFTDEDKVFFIHFLHWRLKQPGAIPSKQGLYETLGEQTTHHNAEAWRRHWDEHPELPDKIYIEARKRAEEGHLRLEPGQPGYARLADSSDEDTEEEDDAAEAVADNASVVSYYDPPEETPKAQAQSAEKTLFPGRSVKPASKPFRHPITADDLRAMAKYKFERRHVWDQYDTKQGPWKEFAERPENSRRKLGSWYLVSRDRAEELHQFYKQYLAEAEGRMRKSTPPRQDSGEAPVRPFATKLKTEKATQSPASNVERPQKRGFERESRVLSPHKRAKQDVVDTREYIEIFDSSD